MGGGKKRGGGRPGMYPEDPCPQGKGIPRRLWAGSYPLLTGPFLPNVNNPAPLSCSPWTPPKGEPGRGQLLKGGAWRSHFLVSTAHFLLQILTPGPGSLSSPHAGPVTHTWAGGLDRDPSSKPQDPQGWGCCLGAGGGAVKCRVSPEQPGGRLRPLTGMKNGT